MVKILTTISLIILFLNSGFLFGQDTLVINDPFSHEARVKNGVPYTGLAVDKYNSGKIKYLIEYQNGKQNGRMISFAQDGFRLIESTYAEGKLNGKFSEWFYSGNLKLECNYVNDEKQGQAKFYQTSGGLWYEGSFNKNKMQGEWVYYNTGGKKEIVYNYNSGQYIRYFDTGEKYAEGIFLDWRYPERGIRKGKWVYYYKNGAKESEGKYELISKNIGGASQKEKATKSRSIQMSQKSGNWKYYNEAGQLVKRESWKNGLPVRD